METEMMIERNCLVCKSELTLEPDGGSLSVAKSGAGYVWAHYFTSDLGWFVVDACDGIQE